MESKIIEYLVKKYEPTGIILFGSRVSEDAPILSDWDIYIFTDKKETEVEDFADLKEFDGQALEISPLPTNTSDEYVLETTSHPVGEIKILYDKSNGLVERIIENTKKAYLETPTPLNNRKIDLYKKILNKFIRKTESRPENEPYVFFGVSQFYAYAIKNWFEVRQEWPLSIHTALPYIKNVDEKFFNLVESLRLEETPYEEKIENMKQIRDALFTSLQ